MFEETLVTNGGYPDHLLQGGRHKLSNERQNKCAPNMHQRHLTIWPQVLPGDHDPCELSTFSCMSSHRFSHFASGRANKSAPTGHSTSRNPNAQTYSHPNNASEVRALWQQASTIRVASRIRVHAEICISENQFPLNGPCCTTSELPPH